MITSTVANAITKIRNASRARHSNVVVNTNKLITGMLAVLKDNGFIKDYTLKTLENKVNVADVELGYNPNPSIVRADIISKSGRRIYVGYKDLPNFYNGLGIAILSTSKGVMSNKEAVRQKVGGELICKFF